MSDAFQDALKFTLFAEGGYSDNPADSGGATDYGITQETWDAYCDAQGLASSPVTGIPLSGAKAIYHGMYWQAGHCDQLPAKLGICHFDWCVNHGVAGAAITLQTALGVAEDGIIGPITLGTAERCDVWPTVIKYLQLREDWYQQDVRQNPSQIVFLDGWRNRVDNLRDYLEGLGAEAK